MIYKTECWKCHAPIEIELTEEQVYAIKNLLMSCPSVSCDSCKVKALEGSWIGDDDVPF